MRPIHTFTSPGSLLTWIMAGCYYGSIIQCAHTSHYNPAIAFVITIYVLFFGQSPLILVIKL